MLLNAFVAVPRATCSVTQRVRNGVRSPAVSTGDKQQFLPWNQASSPADDTQGKKTKKKKALNEAKLFTDHSGGPKYRARPSRSRSSEETSGSKAVVGDEELGSQYALAFKDTNRTMADIGGFGGGRMEWYALWVLVRKEEVLGRELEIAISALGPVVNDVGERVSREVSTWSPTKEIMTWNTRSLKMAPGTAKYRGGGWLFLRCIMDDAVHDLIQAHGAIRDFKTQSQMTLWSGNGERVVFPKPLSEEFMAEVQQWIDTEEEVDEEAIKEELYGSAAGDIKTVNEKVDNDDEFVEYIGRGDGYEKVYKATNDYSGTYENPNQWVGGGGSDDEGTRRKSKRKDDRRSRSRSPGQRRSKSAGRRGRGREDEEWWDTDDGGADRRSRRKRSDDWSDYDDGNADRRGRRGRQGDEGSEFSDSERSSSRGRGRNRSPSRRDFDDFDGFDDGGWSAPRRSKSRGDRRSDSQRDERGDDFDFEGWGSVTDTQQFAGDGDRAALLPGTRGESRDRAQQRQQQQPQQQPQQQQQQQQRAQQSSGAWYDGGKDDSWWDDDWESAYGAAPATPEPAQQKRGDGAGAGDVGSVVGSWGDERASVAPSRAAAASAPSEATGWWGGDEGPAAKADAGTPSRVVAKAEPRGGDLADSDISSAWAWDASGDDDGLDASRNASSKGKDEGTVYKASFTDIFDQSDWTSDSDDDGYVWQEGPSQDTTPSTNIRKKSTSSSSEKQPSFEGAQQPKADLKVGDQIEVVSDRSPFQGMRGVVKGVREDGALETELDVFNMPTMKTVTPSEVRKQ